MGVEIDDRNTSEAEESGDDGSGNISDVSTVDKSSDGRSETNGNRNVPSTSTFGSTGKCEKKTRQRSTSSSSSDYSNRKVTRKRKRILIESDSSSDKTFEDGKNASQTSETLMGKKPMRIVVDGISLYKCPECEDTSKSKGKTYSHMAQCHGMKKFECSFCHFSTPNKTSMSNHRKKYCRELKKKDSKKSNTNTSQKPKPVMNKIDGVIFYKCPLCEYMAKSIGKIDSHLVTKHGYENFECDYCKFSTPNSTSMHNHKKLYCRSLKK